MLADRLHLQAGRLRLELAPDMGGSIAALDWMDGSVTHPVMRDGRAARNVLEASSFPLVPFVNRIRGGSFRFGRREVRLAPNMAGDPNPLHGQGWLAAWQVAAASESRAVLCFRHEPGEWPWAYEARQDFSLNPDGLFVRLSCRNASDERMPCGLGQHPYFPCRPETRIHARVDCAWNIDAQVLPTEKAPATGRYDLAARSICAQDLDNGFGGWSGEAVISDPEWPFEVRLSSPGTRYFHIYSPPSGGFFAAEPVTHANAALNEPEEEWPMVGLKILEPGEEMSLDLRIELVEKLSGLGDR